MFRGLRVLEEKAAGVLFQNIGFSLSKLDVSLTRVHGVLLLVVRHGLRGQ